MRSAAPGSRFSRCASSLRNGAADAAISCSDLDGVACRFQKTFPQVNQMTFDLSLAPAAEIGFRHGQRRERIRT